MSALARAEYKITKRDGRVVPFDIAKIERAMEKAFAATGNPRVSDIPSMSGRVIDLLDEEETPPRRWSIFRILWNRC